MKSILETTGIQAVVHISATVSPPVDSSSCRSCRSCRPNGAGGNKEPGMCRCTKFPGLPDYLIPPAAGWSLSPTFELPDRWHSWALRASRIFMAAVEVLIKESTASQRSQTLAPSEFGGFELRKDPAEIFGEGRHDHPVKTYPRRSGVCCQNDVRYYLCGFTLPPETHRGQLTGMWRCAWNTASD